MAWLTLDEVLASVCDSDDDNKDFSHLHSESEESAYTCQQQFGLEKLSALSQVVSTEPLASSSRLCVVQFLDSAGALEMNSYKYIRMETL